MSVSLSGPIILIGAGNMGGAMALGMTGIDLAPLAGLGLEELWLEAIPATDLAPVGRIKSLKRLGIESMGVESGAFVSGLAELTWLAACLAGKPLALRLCMQAGGSMPKYYGLDADATSVLPDRALVDYVRVLTPA